MSVDGNTSNFARHITSQHPERLTTEDYQRQVIENKSKKRRIDQTEMIMDDAGIVKVSLLIL